MAYIVGVRFKQAGRIYYFDPGDLALRQSDGVIVETARGVEYGDIIYEKREIPDSSIPVPLKKIMRKATAEDEEILKANRKKEEYAYTVCEEKIKIHKLGMKLIGVDYTFDGNKILFYFTADGRVDFRNLVKDLASVFRTRIELRQVGVRDEAKMLGGLGICGCGLCCTTYLEDFAPVSIKMAKEQGLSLNPTKISGSCGRLMCCLKYEQESYEELIKITPKVGAIVKTPDGKGVVHSASLLKSKVRVRLDGDAENILGEYDVGKIKVIKDAARKDDSHINIQGLEKLEWE